MVDEALAPKIIDVLEARPRSRRDVRRAGPLPTEDWALSNLRIPSSLGLRSDETTKLPHPRACRSRGSSLCGGDGSGTSCKRLPESDVQLLRGLRAARVSRRNQHGAEREREQGAGVQVSGTLSGQCDAQTGAGDATQPPRRRVGRNRLGR